MHRRDLSRLSLRESSGWLHRLWLLSWLRRRHGDTRLRQDSILYTVVRVQHILRLLRDDRGAWAGCVHNRLSHLWLRRLLLLLRCGSLGRHRLLLAPLQDKARGLCSCNG